MTARTVKGLALALAALAMVMLAWSLQSHSWFRTRPAGTDARESVALSLGPWSMREVRVDRFTNVTTSRELRNVEYSIEREAAYQGARAMPGDVRDAASFWKAGLVLIGLGSLAVLALGFAMISTFNATRPGRAVSPRGVVAAGLVLACLASVPLVVHVRGYAVETTGHIVVGPALLAFYVAAALGLIANELLAKHRAAESTLPEARVLWASRQVATARPHARGA
jgi:hypothetical protein